MGWREQAWERRSKRTLERQLQFMQELAASFRDQEAEKSERLKLRAQRLREKLARVRPIRENDRVLEVGSGATGYIFHLGIDNAVGVDPLADHYQRLFPLWQAGVKTVVSGGEAMPFDNNSFDVVLCDNVIDHAEGPAQILREITRVLKPEGVFYFTVHVHHPIYQIASGAYGLWRALGVPVEITPFADHTVHLTPGSARRLLIGLPLAIAGENYTDAERQPFRHLGDRLKHFFYKNRTWEVVALRQSQDPE